MQDRGMILKKDEDIDLEINKISAPKFKEGGAAMFLAEKQNHQNVIEGKKDIMPLVIYIPREFVVSYVIFARENIHEEQRPWAISIINAPCHPQVVLVIIPAVASPMCLTEE